MADTQSPAQTDQLLDVQASNLASARQSNLGWTVHPTARLNDSSLSHKRKWEEAHDHSQAQPTKRTSFATPYRETLYPEPQRNEWHATSKTSAPAQQPSPRLPEAHLQINYLARQQTSDLSLIDPSVDTLPTSINLLRLFIRHTILVSAPSATSSSLRVPTPRPIPRHQHRCFTSRSIARLQTSAIRPLLRLSLRLTQ